MGLGKIFRMLPFSDKLAWMIPYYREAVFFKKVKDFKEDKELKSAMIRKIAHSLDKDLTAFEKPRVSGNQQTLEKLLKEWTEAGFEKNETIAWAEELLKEHKKKTTEK